MIKAKARFGHGAGRIIVDDCPYCHKTHYHNPPVESGVKAADCFKGEYLLDFTPSEEVPDEERDDHWYHDNPNY